MDDQRWEPSGDPGHSDSRPVSWEPPALPPDHARMGLTRNTEEGALIELAANLDGARASHRAVAWLLLVVFALPVLLTAAHLLGL